MKTTVRAPAGGGVPELVSGGRTNRHIGDDAVRDVGQRPQDRGVFVVEPGVLDNKCYVKGIGNVAERTVQGGSDTLDLVSVTH